mmetsp:Transcript_10817/g.15844  ORF Transcript_10817/g.15844 Transcript_10817/m.15844 type:complete len:234 (+) Transcript_10817:143-844(+)
MSHTEALPSSFQLPEDTPNNSENAMSDEVVFSKMDSKKKKRRQKHKRSVPVPTNRVGALKKDWQAIYLPIVEKLHLDIRYNTKKNIVEIRTNKNAPKIEIDGRELDPAKAIQKAADFVNAYVLGFELKDIVCLLRQDDFYVDSFKVNDVKYLSGDHLGRAIGRVAGAKGSTLFVIQNTTKTRIVLANDQVHILGKVTNINHAKRAVCDLILGAPPGSVYNRLKVLSARQKESF